MPAARSAAQVSALASGAVNVLLDARELRRERESGIVDDAYSMRSSFEDFRAHRDALRKAGLTKDGAITDEGEAALLALGHQPTAPARPRAKRAS